MFCAVQTFRRALELKDAEIGAANEGRRRAEAAAVGAQSTLEAVRMEHSGAVAERARLEAAVTAEKDNARRERESGEAARDKARREVEEARERRQSLEEQVRRCEETAESARRDAAAAREELSVAAAEASTHAAALLASRKEL